MAARCSGCRRTVPVDEVMRVGAGALSDKKFCSQCPACPCGKPDCNTDARRVELREEFHNQFVLGPANHYILDMERPCWECGEESNDPGHVGYAYGRHYAKCFVCEKCITGNGCCRIVKLYDVPGVAPPDSYVKHAHAECLKCVKCNITEAQGDWRNDWRVLNEIHREWGVREDDTLVHIICGPCEFPDCPNPTGTGKFERSGNLVVHAKHGRDEQNRQRAIRRQQNLAAKAAARVEAYTPRQQDLSASRRGISVKKPSLKRAPRRGPRAKKTDL